MLRSGSLTNETLRAPEAVLTSTGTEVAISELSTACAPGGTFKDTEFTPGTYEVPRGCRILIYSDGASEIVLADGEQLSSVGFANATRRLAQSPNWSLNELVEELSVLTPPGTFQDDCSLIQLRFD